MLHDYHLVSVECSKLRDYIAKNLEIKTKILEKLILLLRDRIDSSYKAMETCSEITDVWLSPLRDASCCTGRSIRPHEGIVEQHGVLGTEVCVVTGGRSQEIVDLGLRLSALLELTQAFRCSKESQC